MNLAFITGSSSGIGLEITKQLLDIPSWQVFGLSRSHQDAFPNFHPVSIDLSKPSDVQGFEFPKLPNIQRVLLINNAGSIQPIKPIGSLDLDQTQQTIQLNLTTPIMLANKFLQAFADGSADKTIINISSGAAFNAIDAWSVYCSSKAGLEMFSSALSQENEGNLRVMSISPGVVDTNMQGEIRTADPGDFKGHARFKELHETGALKNPADVAGQILSDYLETDKAGSYRL